MSNAGGFPPLNQTSIGFDLWLGPVLLAVNWARTWVWADDSADGSIRTNRFVSAHLSVGVATPLIRPYLACLVLGPLRITVGWTRSLVKSRS